MSLALEIRGVYRRKRQMTHHGKASKEVWTHWLQMKPYRGIYVASYSISLELYLKLIEDGVERLEDR